MASFTVPFTDHQIDVDSERRLVLFYRNAWNRESCGTPDESYPFEVLCTDAEVLLRLTGMLAAQDAAELERLVRTRPAAQQNRFPGTTRSTR